MTVYQPGYPAKFELIVFNLSLYPPGKAGIIPWVLVKTIVQQYEP
jgi:hypothetical protein